MKDERLNALAMLSINKNFVHNISNFDEKVAISEKQKTGFYSGGSSDEASEAPPHYEFLIK